MALAIPAVARAQAQRSPGEGSGVVVVDLVGEVEAGPDQGVLVRTAGSSMAPMLAVYVGLTLLGGTLALITSRRRVLTVRARELATGVAAGRRARSDFWDTQPRAGGRPGISSPRDPQIESGIPIPTTGARRLSGHRDGQARPAPQPASARGASPSSTRPA